MTIKTDICDRLGCRYPILQAGMGGVARSELVSAVLAAGGYGFLGMVRESPELVTREIKRVRESSDRPFGVNLIPAATDSVLFDEELAACFDNGVHSVCFFWDLHEEAIKRAKRAGCVVLYQVGNVADAVSVEQAGADMVIAQGSEAGGHIRGLESSLVLVPQVAKAVSVPVIASGGFASGASLIAALALGAQGIHCGTAFLATRESFAHEYHKERVVAARTEDTVYTDIFAINWPPHSPVRVIATDAVSDLGRISLGHRPYENTKEIVGENDDQPIYRWSTDSPLRTTTGDIESMALFGGQIVGEIDRVEGAGEIISKMVQEATSILANLSRFSKVEGNHHCGFVP